MEFRVLGPLEIVASGQALPLGGAKQRAVIALLLLQSPEPVAPDRLIDELWGERPPASAAHAVQVYVSTFRKLIRDRAGPVAIQIAPSGYRLEVDRECVDAHRAERLLDDGQRALKSDPHRARTLLEEAAGLFRGPPLADLTGFQFALRERSRLEELQARTVECLVEARLALGEHADVISTLTRLVESDPLREGPQRLLMLSLYRSGRHAEALAAYRDAREALDAIGLHPGPELRKLEEAILRHDVSLGALAHEPVAEQVSAPPPKRKVVTALFSDVTGSTALGEQLDPEVLLAVVGRYLEVISAVVEAHGGTVQKFTGDAVMAVFGIPLLHEDDALRAVRAAAELRQRLPALAEEFGVVLQFRTGVNTGAVLMGEGDSPAIGDAVNVAARLEQAAEPGEIIIGEATLRLIRDAVEVEPLESLTLEGKAERVGAFRLLDVDPLAPGLARHLDLALVDRERELGLLRAAWDRSTEESGCHLFTLLGAAGVGKSRLVAEFLATVGDIATILPGRCLHYGEGITFWPLLEALAGAGEPAKPVIERLSHGGAATPEELFFEVRRLLEALALQSPVILHVDDLQWAESMLLDLLDHVIDLSRGAPILVVCSARSELLENRPTWGGGKLNATTVLLEPLAASDCELLLDRLGNDLVPEARARVIAASEGNPLFLEELAVLTHERGKVTVPATIEALLTARLDHLPAGERELLEHGAIEGEVFHTMPLGALSATPPAELEQLLAGLVRKDLIHPHPASFRSDRAFRFRHLLIRDAAYDSLPKAARAELHQQFAVWLENNARELSELDEISGWHLEQAVRCRQELAGGVDSALAQRAAGHLHAAGRRASERGDIGAAVGLLERSLGLAPEDSTMRASACVDLAEQLIDTGDLARVNELLSEVEQDADLSELAVLTRFEWMIHSRPEDAVHGIQGRLPPILKRLSEAGDARGLAKAHMAAASLHWLLTEATAAGDEFRLVADYARQAGDGGMRSRALGEYIRTLVYGRQDASTLASEIARIEEEDLGPYLNAFLDLGRSEFQRLKGDFDEARRFIQRAIDGFGSLGMGAVQGGLEQDLGQIELSAGEPAAALAALMRSDSILAELGERTFRSSTQALLADAYERLGERTAARAAIDLSGQLSASDDVINNVITCRVRGRLAVTDGDYLAAERWARRAVEYALSTDFIRDTAKARLDLARVLAALGRPREAAEEALAALELFESKGDRPGVAEATELLDRTAP